MIVTVSGAVVVGGVRFPVQTQVTVPDPAKRPEQTEGEN